MPVLDLFNQEKVKVGNITLREDVFGVPVNISLVHQVLKAQLAGKRQGTASTKTKGEVRGGGRKPFRQKGTGNARQGSLRTPLRPGGGQTFGPRPRSYKQATPKEMVRGALRSALSDRVRSNRMLVIDEFKLDSCKTRTFNEILKKKWVLDKVLIIDGANPNLELSSRNIPRVKTLKVDGINVYDLIRYDWLLMTRRAVEAIETRLGKHSTAEIGSSEERIK
jgi:large subunit ribosomal protein L4